MHAPSFVRSAAAFPCSIDGCEKRRFRREWCRKHYEDWRKERGPQPRLTADERFWAKVDADGDCWEWTAGRDPYGYGLFTPCTGKHKSSHRWAWERLVGPVQEGLELDHRCRNRLCCNPDHLEPVPHVVNLRRGFGIGVVNNKKTHCLKGHPLSGDNLTVRFDGSRRCRECHRQSERRRRAERRRGPADGLA